VKVGAPCRLLRLGTLLLLLAGCATPQLDALLVDPAGLPSRAEVANVPFYPQEKLYCGPAAMAMALTWAGRPISQEEIATQVYTAEREGTLRTDMIAAARRHGRLAVHVTSLRALLHEVAAGTPVVVFQNLGLRWYPRWHYAVAVGYDLEENVLLLRSGAHARLRTELELFERTWARGGDWAIVVLPPERLPVTAGEQAVLAAAVGLERASHPVAAAQTYTAMARRWPESVAARVGLGNSRFAAGDFPGAERAYRLAVELRPASADAWNNLAYALARQGRREEALDAARRAVDLGGERIDAYRDTLHELFEEPQ
jgi:tetratricopeptide (TPR) repeat protein